MSNPSMQLLNEHLRYDAAITPRVDALLAAGCYCGNLQATLTQRTINRGVTVNLQCSYCGRSLGGALPRKHFFEWHKFPLWDAELPDRYARLQQRLWQARAGEFNARLRAREAAREQAWLELRQDYHRWLLHSAEWAMLRHLVLQRDMETCQACLGAGASHVHHKSYAYGRIPPAWELTSVCRRCHDRLHTDWMPSGTTAEVERRIAEILGE